MVSKAQLLQYAIVRRRVSTEFKILNDNKSNNYQVIRNDEDDLSFYFLIKGNDGSCFENGYYLGKIVIPENYPVECGAFYMLTPNSRFNVNRKICINISSQLSLKSPQILTNFNNFYLIFMCDNISGIGLTKETVEQRKIKAKESVLFNSTNYPDIIKKFDQYFNPDGTMKIKG